MLGMARRGRYGIDAPYALFFLGGGALLFAALAALTGRPSWSVSAVLLGLMAASYLYTTRAGKFAEWTALLDGLALRGDERVLDVGCGRGAVLVLLAERLPRGRAVGLDLWSQSDQSGNGEAATRDNAAREGVADRVELHTGDMRAMPFPDGSMDAVVSSLAVHNIPDAAGRQRAIDEVLRVLRPGGRLLLADFRATDEYARRLRERGAADVTVRRLGWRFWYGGPHAATKLVSARRPAG